MAMEEILAPVTGMVWKIETSTGAALSADSDIMILESMKMEIGVQAPAGGKLVELMVAEGDAVDEGQVVAVVDTGE